MQHSDNNAFQKQWISQTFSYRIFSTLFWGTIEIQVEIKNQMSLKQFELFNENLKFRKHLEVKLCN